MTPSAATLPESGARRTWPYALILLAMALGLYANALSGPFVFDDESAIVQNTNLRSLTPIRKALDAPPYTGANGRPLVALTLALNYSVGGYAVEGYRLFNVLLHGLCAMLLFGVLRRALLAAGARAPATAVAWATGLLWVVHPLCTDAVNLVITRNEQLMALGYLATLYAALRGFEGAHRRAWLTASVAACALGMASKENMVSAPLTVLLFDRTFVSGTFVAALRRRPLFYAGLATTWVLLALLMAGAARGETVGLERGMTSMGFFLTQAEVIPHYLRLCVWPTPLIMDYGDWYAFQGERGWFPWAAGLLVAGGLLAWLLVRRRALGFAGFVFLALLAPTSSFIPITGEVAAEHRMYLPLAAVLFALVVAGWSLGRRLAGPEALRRALGLALVAGLTLAGALATRARNADYATADGIWRDSIAKRPLNARAYCGLATELIRQDRRAEAVEQLERSLRLRPSMAESHRLLGAIFARSGRAAEAEQHYRAAARFEPGLPTHVFDVARRALEAGDPGFAAECLTDVLHMRPDFPAAKLTLGWIRAASPDARLRDGPAAQQLAEELCARRPSAAHLDLLAAAQARSGRHALAVETAGRALAATNDPGLRARIAARRALYRAGRPFEGSPGVGGDGAPSGN